MHLDCPLAQDTVVCLAYPDGNQLDALTSLGLWRILVPSSSPYIAPQFASTYSGPLPAERSARFGRAWSLSACQLADPDVLAATST